MDRMLGENDGASVWISVGARVGTTVGSAVVTSVGNKVGTTVGTTVGISLIIVGLKETVGDPVNVVGAALGTLFTISCVDT